jgi:hypothetical protein
MSVGAFGVGLSKTGIAGLGIVAVAFFAVALPAKMSVGVVLPVLITGDICAVALYRRKAVWSHLVYLFPWAIVGVVAGYFALGHIDDSQVGRLIGAILIALTIVQLARRRAQSAPDSDADTSGVVQSHVTMALMGVLAGFTTMVANAAGPIMVLYLLSTRLPKVEFIGTGAWFFFLLNLFKVPFSANLGLINTHSLPIDAALVPFVVAGAVAGRSLLHKIDQRLFENLAIGLTVAAAVRLLW